MNEKAVPSHCAMSESIAYSVIERICQQSSESAGKEAVYG